MIPVGRVCHRRSHIGRRYKKRSLAVELYREGRLSLGKAAELAGAKNKWEMLMLLSERGGPLDCTANYAEKDLQTLKSMFGGIICRFQLHIRDVDIQDRP
jgi:predicted HTH domain antitoxin